MQITGKTNIVGVFGWPVEHSLSPQIHNAAYEKMGVNYTYIAFPVQPENIESAIKGVKNLGIKGINCTIPHKQLVQPFLNKISEEARQIGAVNTIKIDGDHLSGFNTDLYGFTKAVEETGRTFKEKRIVLIGAGGVGRAMGFAAAHAGVAELTILNRTEAKAEQLAKDINHVFPALSIHTSNYESCLAADHTRKAHIVANATSVGMHEGDSTPIPVDWLNPESFIYDTIYNRRSPLLVEAEAKGCENLDGASMLVHQGAKAIEIWTGQKPDTSLMLTVLLENLTNK